MSKVQAAIYDQKKRGWSVTAFRCFTCHFIGKGFKRCEKWNRSKPETVNCYSRLLLHVAFVEETFTDVHKRSYMQPSEGDFGDTVLGDQRGLNSEMQQLQAFQNRFNLSSTEAQPLLKWLPPRKRGCGHRCVAVQNAIKGYIPNHCTFLIIAHTSSYAKRMNFKKKRREFELRRP